MQISTKGGRTVNAINYWWRFSTRQSQNIHLLVMWDIITLLGEELLPIWNSVDIESFQFRSAHL